MVKMVGVTTRSPTHDSGAHDDQSYYGKYGKATPTFKPKGPPRGWSSPGKKELNRGQPFGGKPSGKAKPSVWRRKDPATACVASDGSSDLWSFNLHVNPLGSGFPQMRLVAQSMGMHLRNFRPLFDPRVDPFIAICSIRHLSLKHSAEIRPKSEEINLT